MVETVPNLNTSLSENLIGYFDQQVLAAYRNEPDKWVIKTDYFEGHVGITETYYWEIQDSAGEHNIDIRFGYRALQNGDLAIAVWLPDLVDKSPGHLTRWRGFHLQEAAWSQVDDRFALWLQRHVEGDWEVENGVRSRLSEKISLVRSVTAEVLDIPLFKHALSHSLSFPSAENTHRYEDAHRELYGYLIDGIDKSCLAALANVLGKTVNTNSVKTVETLQKLLPRLLAPASFDKAYARTSEARRQAAHGVRAPAKRWPAFTSFSDDLELWVLAADELLTELEDVLKVDAIRAAERHMSKQGLPPIGRPSESYYSICSATEMVGKTVERVEFGFREDLEGVHGAEALIIHFTDGSILGLSTGSNAGNVASQHPEMRPEDFRTSFDLNWVPPLNE
ncbi:MAG TPA: hypothetical protein VF006_19795 [Longimicrobium sp.]